MGATSHSSCAVSNYYLAALMGVFLTAISQLLMKQGARKAAKGRWHLYLNRYTLTAYFTLAVVTLLSLYAYKEIPLKMGLALAPLALILVGLLSSWLLGERLTRMQILGAAVILIGVTIFNL
jgi:drug/metabolite transporter (DMT)-like permease